jgi:membrane protease YdiL (CAAX protease family)
MDPRRLLPIVALGEGLLLAAALALAWWLRVPLDAGRPLAGTAWGIAGAVALGSVNLLFLRARRNGWPGGALRHVCRVIVRPLFEHVRVWHILVISALAGLGEELLFRGVLQPIIGPRAWCLALCTSAAAASSATASGRRASARCSAG